MIDPITQLGILVVNVGCNVYNNLKAKRLGAELQSRQQEFVRAQTDRQFERMRQLQSEAEQLQIELDDEVHSQRLNDIKHEYDNLLTSTAFAANILDWPLNSLPFLIKGESLGTMLGVTRKDIAIHCFFTISNNKSFNENIYAELDQKIEQFCNLNYGPTSSHQMIYYGNGWKRNVEPTKGRVDQLKSNLNSLPTILISPHFSSITKKMSFEVSIWGMGLSEEYDSIFSVYPNEDYFSYNYTNETNFADDDVKLCSLEELPLYIASIYAYISDVYYHKYYRIPPILPSVLQGMPEAKQYIGLYKDNYLKLSNFNSNESQLLNSINALATIRSLSLYYSKEEYLHKLQHLTSIIYDAILNNYISNTSLPVVVEVLKQIEGETSDNELLTLIKKCNDEINKGFVINKLSVDDINNISHRVECVDVFDLGEMIDRYETFIEKNHRELDKDNLSLYFQLIDNGIIDIHIMENDSKMILVFRVPFNYRIKYQTIKRRKQFNSIFKNRPALFCRTDRIPHLREIYNSDMLIF